MKITAVNTLLAWGGRQNWVIVHVETDAGITGLGSADLEGRERAVASAVEELARHIIGEDPTRIEYLWQVMYRHGFWRGGVVLNTALSGIEHALWDITGKELGVPVWRLLGGACRDRIPLYTHTGGATIDALCHHTLELIDQGWRAFKTGPLRFHHFATEGACIRANVERLRALREAVGPDVQLMLDAHGTPLPTQAVRLIRALEEYDLFFCEEFVPPDNIDALAKLAQASLNTNLATGERLFTKWGYRELLEKQYVDIIQPDVCHDGGLLETRKIAAMAETYYVRVAPHNPNGPVATAVGLQMGACLPNFCMLESATASWQTEIVREPFVITDGAVGLPTGPGLGIELDYAALARLPYQPNDYARQFDLYGAPADV
jgi:galactonate dehydratase